MLRFLLQELILMFISKSKLFRELDKLDVRIKDIDLEKEGGVQERIRLREQRNDVANNLMRKM